MLPATHIYLRPLLVTFLFACTNQSSTEHKVLGRVDTARIENRIKQKDNIGYRLISDTLINADAHPQFPSYYSVTNFYFNAVTRELYKAESILQAASRSVFVAHFEKGEVVKTIAHTDLGLFVDYHFPIEPDEIRGMRHFCLVQAKQLQEMFVKKLTK